MLKERAEGSIMGLHHCYGHTAVTCCWRDFVAPPLHHQKTKWHDNWSWNQSFTKLIRHPLSVRHTIYKGIHIRQSKAYCTYYLHTHTETHSFTQTYK